jgi:hypothetical protein
VGYIGVSGATLPTEQLPYLASAGLFGLFALGVAATLWLSADLRDEWRKLDDIHHELRAQREEDEPLEMSAKGAPSTASSPRRSRRAGASADRG